VGLQQEKKLGVNPYKFGMIGSTDAHTSLATTRDENNWSKTPTMEPSSDRWEHVVIASVAGDEALTTYSYETLASGLAGVWARENTREALFEAMQKKETYATTGTRITVRFFGGLDYGENDVFRPDAVAIGYRKGVPMGGDLREAPNGAGAPFFMVGAAKDPWSCNLDRVQIVKGWVDEGGDRHERVYDVAVSNGPARSVRTAAAQRQSATRSTKPRRAISTTLVMPNCAPCGPIRTSIQITALSTTFVSWRSRPLPGRLTTRSSSASKCRRTYR